MVARLSPETAEVRFGFASYKGGKFELIAINIKTGEEITLEGQLRPDQTLEQIDKVLPTCVYVNGAARSSAGTEEPAAYLHTMHMELGQTQRKLMWTEPSPFGIPGKHYSAEYAVSCAPLYLHPAQTKRISGAINQVEEAACLIWAELCPGMVMGDADLPHYEAAAKAVLAMTSTQSAAPSPVQEAFAYIASDAKALAGAKTRAQALNIIQNWLAMTSTNCGGGK